MKPTSKRELVLTGELLEYARASTWKVVRKRCPPHLSPRDMVQETLLRLIARPPKYDPTKGATEKTLLFRAIECLVAKRVAIEREKAKRFEDAFQEPVDRRPKRSTAELTLDDILRFIDSEESRELCRCFVECNGNRTKVARRLGLTEGTVRYRLKLLAPKMRAAGFDPEQYGEFQ